MKESSLVRRLLAELNATPGCKAIKIHGSPYQRVGTPDIIGCKNGKFFAVEVKMATGKLTKIQQKELDEWKDVGAQVMVYRPNKKGPT